MKRKIQKKTTNEAPEQGQVDVYPPAQTLEPAIVDAEDWLVLLEPTFRERPEAAETLARRLYDLKEAVESGKVGLAIESLGEGIRQAWRYTATHQAAFRLFQLHLAGEVVSTQDEPQRLLGAALDRVLSGMRERGIEAPAFLKATGDRALSGKKEETKEGSLR